MHRIVALFITLTSLVGCNLYLNDTVQPTRPSIIIASVTPDLTAQLSPTDSPFPDGVYDALPSTMGICFESVWDAAGRTFVIRNAEDHINFYNQADNSNLCSRPVRREPFDFRSGDVLVGTWTRGTGCTAQYDLTSFERDNNQQTIMIEATFSTEGDCNYQLVRGFWIGINDAQSYSITLTVLEA